MDCWQCREDTRADIVLWDRTGDQVEPPVPLPLSSPLIWSRGTRCAIFDVALSALSKGNHPGTAPIKACVERTRKEKQEGEKQREVKR